jgi:Helix-turn-helix domain
MGDQENQSGGFPLLESILRQKGLSLLGIYRYRDASRILGTSVRTIQEWCRDKKLRRRNLPGRGKFLSQDLEEFLRDSHE